MRNQEFENKDFEELKEAIKKLPDKYRDGETVQIAEAYTVGGKYRGLL